MTITAAKLLVQVDGDTRTAVKELDALEKKLKGMEKAGESMTKLGKSMTLGLTAPIMAAGAASVFAASNLNESMNKVNVVFGASADAIEEWSQSAATSFGMSQQAALEATGTFGNLFTSMGMGVGKSAEMSQGLVELAADLASFNNIDPTVALEKLRAGLVGEVEPLRTLGVNLSAAAVEQQAFAMGLASTTEELTPAILAQARYALIMEQTQNAQGDFARTSDEFANSMRVVKAEVIDLAASFGAELLPFVKEGVTRAKELLAGFQDLSPETKRMIIEFAGVVAILGPALIIIGKVTTAISTLASVSQGAWLALAGAAGPVGLIIAGLVSLGVAIGLAIEDWKNYKEAMAGTGRSSEEVMNTLAELSGNMSMHTGKIHDVAGAWEALEARQKAAAEAAKKAAEDQVEAAKKAAEAYANLRRVAMEASLQAGLSGALTGAMQDYKQTLVDLGPEHDALLARLQFLDQAGWIPSAKSVEDLAAKLRDENSAMTEGEAATQARIMLLASHNRQLDETKKALEGNEAAQAAAAEAMRQATAEMIYQQAAAGLDAAASLELARSMGMISEQDYAVAAVIQNLKVAFDANADGMISASEGAMQFAGNVNAVYQAVAELEAKNVPVTLQNIQLAMQNLANQPPASLPIDVDTSSLTLLDPESPEFATARASLTSSMQLAATQAAEAAKPSFDQLNLDASAALTAVSATFTTTDMQIPGKAAGEGIVTGFKAGINGGDEKGGGGIMGISAAVIADLKKLWTVTTSWPNVGLKIMEGIAAGVTSGTGVLTAAVEAAIQAALDAAKAAGQIQSPSQLFADQVGVPISQGIAAGILQAAPLPASAVQSVITNTSQTVYQQPISVYADVRREIDYYEMASVVAGILRG